MSKAKKDTAAKVAKDGVIADGKGGWMKKGDELPADCDLDSLKAKGFAE